MLLNKNDIFASKDLTFREVEIPQWGGNVRIKVMSIAEQIAFERLNKSKKDDSELVFALLSQCCVDEDGNHLFNEDDISELNKKSSTPVLVLFKACLDLNSMNQVDLDKQAKNS